MLETIIYYIETFVEVDHFPGFELYVVFTTCFWISVIFHLHKLRKRQRENQMEFIKFCSTMLNAMQGLRDITEQLKKERK